MQTVTVLEVQQGIGIFLYFMVFLIAYVSYQEGFTNE